MIDPNRTESLPFLSASIPQQMPPSSSPIICQLITRLLVCQQGGIGCTDLQHGFFFNYRKKQQIVDIYKVTQGGNDNRETENSGIPFNSWQHFIELYALPDVNWVFYQKTFYIKRAAWLSVRFQSRSFPGVFSGRS